MCLQIVNINLEDPYVVTIHNPSYPARSVEVTFSASQHGHDLNPSYAFLNGGTWTHQELCQATNKARRVLVAIITEFEEV